METAPSGLQHARIKPADVLELCCALEVTEIVLFAREAGARDRVRSRVFTQSLW